MRKRDAAGWLLLFLCATAPILATTGASAQALDNCVGSKDFIREKQPFAKGRYLSYLASWNKGELLEGRDYWQCLAFNRGTYPDGQTIAWSWPNRPPPSRGVYNFLAVNFGNYYDTIVPQPIPPKPVSDIKTLKQKFDLGISGDLDGFDVIQDFFLTRDPGKFDHKLFELEIFLHTPSYSHGYARQVSQVGKITASGVQWNVSVDKHAANGQDILVVPANGADLLSAEIDTKAILDQLVAAGVLTGTEYFNGLGLGVEVRQGSGRLDVHKLSTVYE
ncbi:hypothetical protein [Rhodoblastus sp.]|uniref:hypothetical protein n=1 Tax=Rhodoblastus sp. TaxID=1962975 RepID=UPI0035AFC312